MVICAVATCDSRSGRDKVTFFSFPNNKELSRIWTFKCKRKYYSPSEHAKICKKHFTDSDFVMSSSFAASVGFNGKLRLKLKPDAVPTNIPEPRTVQVKKKKSPRKSKAIAKRRHLEVSAVSCAMHHVIVIVLGFVYYSI